LGSTDRAIPNYGAAGFVSGAGLCHEYKMNAITNTFYFAKEMAQENPKYSVQSLIDII
jgi:hypothetical protein